MIVVIDYGICNVRSVVKALELIGGNVVVSDRAKDLEKADRIVLPGVGAFGDGMKNLRTLGLIEALSEQVIQKRKPFLGICLGMQLLARESHEFGVHQGLGWIPATVKPLTFNNNSLKVPHIGWNEVYRQVDTPLFVGVSKMPTFYFVHSYHMVCDTPDFVAAWCDYGGPFTAAIQRGNIFATQFHPEKSQDEGLHILENFLNWHI